LGPVTTDAAGAARNRPDTGILVMSLDFELAWGLRDHVREDHWQTAAEGTPQAAPKLLQTLQRHGVHATWAAVGFLFLSGWDELPAVLPQAAAGEGRPLYAEALRAAAERRQEVLHFAPDLIRAIMRTPHQELATHTLSHYCCLGPDHTPEAFRDNLRAAIEIAERFGVRPRTIIFPRNQFTRECLKICAEQGITCYRGVLPGWMYGPRAPGDRAALLRRGLRVVSEHLAIFGLGCYPLDSLGRELPLDLPASRQLRPLRPPAALEDLRLKQIRAGMTRAAREGMIYHLWSHPHNFAGDTDRKLRSLEQVLEHFDRLHERYGMASMNMAEVVALVNPGGGAQP